MGILTYILHPVCVGADIASAQDCFVNKLNIAHYKKALL